MLNNKNLDIEILRAVAVISVIIHHAMGSLLLVYPAWIKDLFIYFDGGAGVDLFFVISGFVIGRSFLPKMEGNYSHSKYSVIKSFLIRRVFRIFPAAWLWLLLLLLASYFTNSSGAFGSVAANIDGGLAALLQFSNYRFEHCFMNYECGPSSVYWSLSLEEQFYIILPLLSLIFRRYIVFVLLILLAHKLFSNQLSYHFAFRYEGLVLGVLLACYANTEFYRRFGLKIFKLNIFFIRMMMFLLLVSMFLVSSEYMSQFVGYYRFRLIAVLAFFIVMISSYNRGCILSGNIVGNFLVWVGSRSFSLYLTHIPVFLIIREMLFLGTGAQQPIEGFVVVFVAFSILLLLLIADISYKFVEVPMRDYGVYISSKTMGSGKLLVSKY